LANAGKVGCQDEQEALVTGGAERGASDIGDGSATVDAAAESADDEST